MQESEMGEWNVLKYDPAFGEFLYSDLEEVDGHIKVWEPLLWGSIHIKVTGVTRGKEIWK